MQSLIVTKDYKCIDDDGLSLLKGFRLHNGSRAESILKADLGLIRGIVTYSHIQSHTLYSHIHQTSIILVPPPPNNTVGTKSSLKYLSPLISGAEIPDGVIETLKEENPLGELLKFRISLADKISINVKTNPPLIVITFKLSV